MQPSKPPGSHAPLTRRLLRILILSGCLWLLVFSVSCWSSQRHQATISKRVIVRVINRAFDSVEKIRACVEDEIGQTAELAVCFPDDCDGKPSDQSATTGVLRRVLIAQYVSKQLHPRGTQAAHGGSESEAKKGGLRSEVLRRWMVGERSGVQKERREERSRKKIDPFCERGAPSPPPKPTTADFSTSDEVEAYWANEVIRRSWQARLRHSATESWVTTMDELHAPVCCLKNFFHHYTFYSARVDPGPRVRYFDGLQAASIELLWATDPPAPAATYVARQTGALNTLLRAFDRKFLGQMVTSAAVLAILLATSVGVLYLLAFLRQWSRPGATVVLALFSLPPFVLALLAVRATDFDPLRVAEAPIEAWVLMLIVAVAAGGVTFDLGRRVIVLVDQTTTSPVIRGLQQFGIQSNVGSIFGAVGSWLKHLMIDVCDVVNVRGMGLSHARGLEHFIMRAVEYRLLGYVAARGVYVFDGLIVLGLIFAVPGLVSETFKMMVVAENAHYFLQGATAIILFSAGLRIAALVVVEKLFPRKYRA